MRSRTIIVGDVHGCIDELEQLLERLAPRAGDRLCFLGDLVDRGPDSLGVVRRVRGLLAELPGSTCIAGNHEEKALRHRDKRRPLPAWASAATAEDWAFLDGLPLVHPLPDVGVVLVHGGFFPKFFEHYGSLGEPQPGWRRARDKRSDRMQRFLRVRRVDELGEMVALGQESSDTVHWSSVYDGREGFCFFGHDAQIDPAVPLRAQHAMGIDTACCFGGALSAAVIESGMPAREASIVSVAGQPYACHRRRWSE